MDFRTTSLVLVVLLATAAHVGGLSQDNLVRINLVREVKPDGKNFAHDYGFELEIDVPEKNSVQFKHPTRLIGFAYIGEIQVGQPARTFRVLLDSLSGDLWLPTRTCPGIDKSIVTTYNRRQSRSFAKDGRRVLLAYKMGMVVEGELAQERIQFGDLSVQNMTFVQVNKNPDGQYLEHHHVDGILGFNMLSRSSYQDVESPIYEIFRHLKQTSHTMESLLSLSLNHGRDPKRAGELIIGGLDESLYVGEVTWAPVTDLEVFQFKVDKIELRWPEDDSYFETPTKEDLLVCQDGCKAVLDTGLSHITGPKRDIEALNKKIRAYYVGRGIYSMAVCMDQNKSLPYLYITISGREFVVTPEQYSFGHAGTCTSPFVFNEAGGDDDHWSLGSLFLGHFYAIFDYEAKRIGLAESSHKTAKSIFA